MHIAACFIIVILAGGIAGLSKSYYEIFFNNYVANQTYTLAFLSVKDNLNKYILYYFIALAGLLVLSVVIKKLFFRKHKWSSEVFTLSLIPLTVFIVWLYADFTLFTITFPQALKFIFLKEVNPGDAKFLLSNLKLVLFTFLGCIILVPVLLKRIGKLNLKSPIIKLIKKIAVCVCVFLFILCLLLNITAFTNFKNTEGMNIVLIVIDALRADHLSCYGYPKKTTPFIDELSKKSLVFDNTYAACSWTSPSCASIFTSFYPFQHGVITGIHARLKVLKKYPWITHNAIPKEITTLPEYLKNYGYKTYGFSANLHICKAEGFDQGFDTFVPSYKYLNAENLNRRVFRMETKIKRNGKYFLYLHYMDPHQPYHQRAPWFIKDKTKKGNSVNAYDSEINYVDNHIRKIFQKFRWDKNTIVIITADHGESFMEHGQVFGHGITLFNEEIHVPLIIYLPDKKIAKRISANVSGIDIFPTIIDAAQLPELSLLEGMSLLKFLSGDNSQYDNRFLYSYLLKTRGRGRKIKQVISQAVFYKHLKYIAMGKVQKLFNLLNDPREKKNLNSAETKTKKFLQNNLKEFEENCRKFTQVKQINILRKKQSNDLKSLGYVQ